MPVSLSERWKFVIVPGVVDHEYDATACREAVRIELELLAADLVALQYQGRSDLYPSSLEDGFVDIHHPSRLEY